MRGGEVQSLALVRLLASRGCPTLLAAPPGTPLYERAGSSGIRTAAWRPRGELDALSALTVRRLVKSERARIIHAHTAHALTLALIARMGLSGVRVVASRRVSFTLRSRLSRRKYRAADAVVAVSGEIRDGLLAEGLDPAKVCVIHSGVDLGRFERLPSRSEARKTLGLAEDAAVVGVVGALVPHKGHAVLFEALGQLAPALPGLHVLLVGEGSLQGDLARDASARNLPVRFVGFVDEPASVYPAMDLLVLPSLSGEGSPGAVKEAAAAGVPVVATDVGGAGEILRDGREALLVLPGNARALGEAVRRLLTDPELRGPMVRAARERVRLFTVEAMADAHVALYRKITASST